MPLELFAEFVESPGLHALELCRRGRRRKGFDRTEQCRVERDRRGERRVLRLRGVECRAQRLARGDRFEVLDHGHRDLEGLECPIDRADRVVVGSPARQRTDCVQAGARAFDELRDARLDVAGLDLVEWDLEPEIEQGVGGHVLGPIMFPGTTHSSNCASVKRPMATAAFLRVVPSLNACLAILAALS